MPRVLNIPVYHNPRVFNMLELEYTRVVNMSGLHKVLCKLYFKHVG